MRDWQVDLTELLAANEIVLKIGKIFLNPGKTPQRQLGTT
jgi:hypothetical protein